MPEPVSVTAGVLLGYAALSAYARNGSAVSDAADAARRSACAVVESGEKSHALFGEKREALSKVRELLEDCGQDDWDENGSIAVSPVAVSIAEELVRMLPEGLPLPEFAAEPDGSVSLDWTASRYRRFAISIGRGARLAYAWKDGADVGHGVALFTGTGIPKRIMEGIHAAVTDERTTLRAA